MRTSVLLLACLAACLAACASATHICDSSFARTYQPNAAGTAYPRQPAITALAPRVLQRGLASQGCTLLSATYYEACANPRPASKPTRFIGTLAFSAQARARCLNDEPIASP